MNSEEIICGLLSIYAAELNKHHINAKIMLNTPRVIPEHTSFLEALDKEVEHMARYKDKIDVLQEYFVAR